MLEFVEFSFAFASTFACAPFSAASSASSAAFSARSLATSSSSRPRRSINVAICPNGPTLISKVKYNETEGYASSPQTRYAFMGSADYDVTDHIKFFSSGRFAQSTTTNYSLTPNNPPTISSISAVTVQKNNATSAIAFTVGDTETAARRLRTAEHAVRDTWTDYLPLLTGAFQPFYQNPATVSMPETGWQAQLVLTLPLYDGGLRYGRRRELEALAAEARAALDAALRQAALSIGVKPGQMFQPVRVAVCGRKVAPPLFETLAVLGRETSLRRLDQAIQLLGTLEKQS